MLKKTIEMLNQLLRANDIKISRSIVDFFADRIRQASTEQTLPAFIERLGNTINVQAANIDSNIFTTFVVMAADAESQRVLLWIRKFPTMAALMAHLYSREKDNVLEAISSITLPALDTCVTGAAPIRRSFDITITCTMNTPLIHGSDTKAGNATLFRRQDVITDTGHIVSLPFYAGNAFRGMLRDVMADQFLRSLDLKPSRTKPPVEVWFFHMLYSGGSLEEQGGKSKKLNDRLGKGQNLNVTHLRELRDMAPSLSVLGTAVGNRIVSGRIEVGDLRPRCREWGTGEKESGELFDWVYLTRREDLETHEEHTGMIATAEVLKPGVVLDGGISMSEHMTDLEKGALMRGLRLLQKKGHIGAESRRDMGAVTMEISGCDFGLADKYKSWVIENRKRITDYFIEIGAINAKPLSDFIAE